MILTKFKSLVRQVKLTVKIKKDIFIVEFQANMPTYFLILLRQEQFYFVAECEYICKISVISLTLWHQISYTCDAQNAERHTYKSTLMQPAFKFQSSAHHYGHLILAQRVTGRPHMLLHKCTK